jgi:hypothetical protein
MASQNKKTENHTKGRVTNQSQQKPTKEQKPTEKNIKSL